MKNTSIVFLIAIIVLGALAVGIVVSQTVDENTNLITNTNSQEAISRNDSIKVIKPSANQKVVSPLEIKGETIGDWYFEAVFPVKIVDANNQVLGQTAARAQSNWATLDFVPFLASLEFSDPETETGTLIFNNDNPSGLPENSEEFSIPIRFE